MAQYTLSDVIGFVQDYLPDVPQAKIVRKLNLIIEDIYTEVGQVQVSTFTTRAPTTSGTVTATAASASLTFSGTPLASTDTLMLIQIDDDATWYKLTYASTSTGTLSSVFAGTGGAGLSYTIVYPTVSFPSDVQQVLSICRQGHEPLEYASKTNLEERGCHFSPAQPTWFSSYLFDAAASPDDAHRCLLIPWPDAAYSFEYSYLPRPTLLTTGGATTQKVLLPSIFNRCVLFGTLALCYGQDDGEGAAGPWWGRYGKELDKAMASHSIEAPRQAQSVYSVGRKLTYSDRWPIG